MSPSTGRFFSRSHSAKVWWAPPFILVLLAIGACEPPDRPPALNPGLTAEARSFLAPDRSRVFTLVPGVVYREVRSGRKPWIVHLIEVDLTRCDLGFRVAATRDDPGRVTVTELVRREGPDVLAAVNGDFFTPEDLPLGIEARAGDLRGRGSRPVFAWRPGEEPWIGPAEWGGELLLLGTWTMDPSSDGETEIVGGYPALLKEGEWVGDLLQGDRPAFAAARHPRTAVGYDPIRKLLWLVVTDGRRDGVAEGMTLPELAELLRALGAQEALNLDGGGSSVMVAGGSLVNRPSDPQGERTVVNALLVRRDASYCTSWHSNEVELTPAPAEGLSTAGWGAR